MLEAAVGIAVPAIPEGLPTVVTITFAISVQRMARRNAIIRRLPAVEPQGSVSRICSDKTDTLTRNEMVVTRAVTAADGFTVTSDGYSPVGEIRKDSAVAAPDSVLAGMALVSAVYNEAEIHEESGTWKLVGDPTEGALHPFAAIFLGLTLPVTPPQILWINMVTSITLALAISFEPHERGVMLRPPREVHRPLLDQFGIWRLAFISFLLLLFTFGTFFWMLTHDHSVELSRTAAVNAMITGQVFYLVNSRFLTDSCFSLRALIGNPWVPVSIGGVIVLQILFTYAPPLQAIFGSEPLPLTIWAWLLFGGVVFFTRVELEKLLVKWAFPKLTAPVSS